MLEDKDFELLQYETPEDTNDVKEETITKDDFELVQIDASVHEQKIETKPTTFLKDSLKRFSKNKSSVVAAYILGGLLLLSVFVPVFDTFDLDADHTKETYLSPKLFDAGTGWWDGTVKYNNVAVDISAKPDATTEEEKQEYWWPSSTVFPQRSAISKKKFTGLKYSNTFSSVASFGSEGYIQFGYYYNREANDNVDFSSKIIPSLTLNNDLYLSVFDIYDVQKINVREGKSDFTKPDNYELGECAFFFQYTDEHDEPQEIKLVDYAMTHNIGSAIAELAQDKVNIAEKIQSETGKDTFKDAYFTLRMVADGKNRNTCSLIGGIAFESNSADAKTKGYFDDMSFTDASACVVKTTSDDYKYWSSTGVKRIYLSKAYYCSFIYDTYEAAYGVHYNADFSKFKLLDYVENGWISFEKNGVPTFGQSGSEFFVNVNDFTCEILDPVNCPLAKPLTIADFDYSPSAVKSNGDVEGNFAVKAAVVMYKYLGYKSMPRFLMGTDVKGRDMFKYVFEGLRTSLLLGIITFAVCFLFGLVWGSISGYFGGTVDLVMERFTDILAGVPWIVMMTLIILKLGQNFATFAIALCMTGWIGTAARTRTQFYRFRGREYVLASRTLGASDARLIAKHILPNALGTIITGAVLMIPSVIFSEATISYLGIGLKNLSSLGVILSQNQSELLTSPYLLIFPSVVIALIMISFNLFGNGLRDAINPSLKGED